jgi:hypothetical protein
MGKCQNCDKQGMFGNIDNNLILYCKEHKTDEMFDLKHKTCIEPECKTRPTFNFTSETKAIYCAKHKKSEMVNVIDKKCLECQKIPAFNYIGEKTAIYCGDHKKVEMIDVKTKKCLNCTKQASFNYAGKSIGIYCAEHKLFDMVDVKSKQCLDCSKGPTFNYNIDQPPIYCFDHKKEHMIDVKHLKCLDCKKRPNYNYIGEINAIYCITHKKNDMINVLSKTCLECLKQPSFNFKGEFASIYCLDHRKEGMIDIRSKKCLDCDKQPSFNFKHQASAIYCSNHRKDGMIDIKSKKCLECSKNASFNFKSESKGLYCLEHKLFEMINVRSKICKCCIQPRYGFIGYSPICCSKCKDPKMVMNPLKKCECKKLATKIKDSVFYCDKHAAEDALDIHEICTICYNKTEIGKQVCDDCSTKISDPIKLHLKELQVHRHLENSGIDIYSYDKTVGESRKRPDFVIKYDDNQIIVVECDEFQHQRTTYTCECEIVRMKQIYFDLFKPTKIRDTEEDACAASDNTEEMENKLLFIRYNPDNYKSESVPFTTMQKLDYLARYIQEFDFDEMETGLYVKYLFYDMFIPTDSAYDLDKINPYI